VSAFDLIRRRPQADNNNPNGSRKVEKKEKNSTLCCGFYDLPFMARPGLSPPIFLTGKRNSPGRFRPCCSTGADAAAPRFLLLFRQSRSGEFDVIFDGFLVRVLIALMRSQVNGRRRGRDRRRLFGCRILRSWEMDRNRVEEKKKNQMRISHRKTAKPHTHRQTDRQQSHFSVVTVVVAQ
jgi:hypothetical protein